MRSRSGKPNERGLASWFAKTGHFCEFGVFLGYLEKQGRFTKIVAIHEPGGFL